MRKRWMPTRAALAFSAICGAAACSSGQTGPGEPVPDNVPGFYEFDEPVPWGEVVRLTGVVEVRVCQEWQSTEQGRRCVRYGYETRFRRETQSIRLRFTRRMGGG